MDESENRLIRRVDAPNNPLKRARRIVDESKPGFIRDSSLNA